MDEIQPLDPAQASRVLALNNEHAEELSWLDAARLAELVGRAFLARRIGAVDAFLLAFDQHADYDCPNFLWFRARYPRFVYVVVCEVNRDPPNPASDAFHAALGFSEVGLAAIHDGRKIVRYLARVL